jgi:hypothetical protein
MSGSGGTGTPPVSSSDLPVPGSAPPNLFRYIHERVFTYNHREADERSRFATVVEVAAGRRLTWQQVTAMT